MFILQAKFFVVAGLLLTLSNRSIWAAGSSCGQCHVSEAKTQPETAMAHAMADPVSNPALQRHPALTFQYGVYHYTVEQQGNRETYSVTDGKDTITVPVKWAFGRGIQTWVLEYQGKRYESLVSFYPAINALDFTVGDSVIHPSNVLEALGRPLQDTETNACFGCHSSAKVADGKLQLDGFTRGVSCSHCHAGADAHSNAILHESLTSIPPKLKSFHAEDVSSFCGQCHRTWETVVTNRWFGVSNVRFQPYRLALSQCYDGVDRRISCVGCHNPHQELVRDDKAYDSKCLACHSPSAAPLSRPAQAKACPVARENCVSCHMPKVELPGGHRAFTDHFIRIVKAGEPYPDRVASSR